MSTYQTTGLFHPFKVATIEWTARRRSLSVQLRRKHGNLRNVAGGKPFRPLHPSLRQKDDVSFVSEAGFTGSIVTRDFYGYRFRRVPVPSYMKGIHALRTMCGRMYDPVIFAMPKDRAAWAAEDATLAVMTPDIIRLSLPDVLTKRGAEWAAEHDKWRVSRLLARLSENEPEDFPLPPADAV